MDVETVMSWRPIRVHFPPKAPNVRAALDNSTRMLFVRDPYNRVFSAYVDKLISPNPYYWKEWGKKAILNYRKSWSNANSSHDTCGQDVTFGEFMSWVLSAGWMKDSHMIPISRHCTPCTLNYTVVGKMETFLRDAQLVFDSLAVNSSQLDFQQMGEDAAFDAILDSTKDSMSADWLKSTLNCVSKRDVVKRIVRKLQIRGIISWRFRMSEDRMDNIGVDGLVGVLSESRDLYASSRGELKVQKRQAYLEALRKLTKGQMDAMKAVYSQDFQLFGYDVTPAVLSRTEVNTDAFDLSKDWDLSPVL